jgi:hypothetical protein
LVSLFAFLEKLQYKYDAGWVSLNLAYFRIDYINDLADFTFYPSPIHKLLWCLAVSVSLPWLPNAKKSPETPEEDESGVEEPLRRQIEELTILHAVAPQGQKLLMKMH